MSFSMPPASLRALAFSMFLVMTSCSAQQMAVTVSSDMALLGGPAVPEGPLLVVLLLLLLPGNRWIKSLMAYLPDGRRKKRCRFAKFHFQNLKRRQILLYCLSFWLSMKVWFIGYFFPLIVIFTWIRLVAWTTREALGRKGTVWILRHGHAENPIKRGTLGILAKRLTEKVNEEKKPWHSRDCRRDRSKEERGVLKKCGRQWQIKSLRRQPVRGWSRQQQ